MTIGSGATFNDQTTSSGLNIVTQNEGGTDNGTTAAVNNQGTFTKSGSAATSTISTTFNNSGIVNIQSGTLNLSGGGTDSGIFNVSSGAAIQFNSAFTLNGASSTGLGQVQLGSSTLTVGSASNFASGFTQLAGSLIGAGTLTVSGLSTLSGGTESGAGTTIASGGAAFTTTSFSLDGGRTLQLGGTSTATGTFVQIQLNGGTDPGSGILTIGSGATFNDQTTSSGLNIVTQNEGGTDNGTTAAVNNQGTFIKSGSAATSTISTTFNNSGVVNVQSGTLTLTGAFSNSGTLNADGGNIHINTAVNDSGSATIFGTSQLQYGASSNEDVTFAIGATGTLILVNSSTYTGHVSGFTGTGDGNPATSDKIDLRDISFAAHTESYSNNVLTISDGVHTAHINFVGSYVLANFHFSNDGSGGTLVTDPPVGGTDQETFTTQNDTIGGSSPVLNPSITEAAVATGVAPLESTTVDIVASVSNKKGGTDNHQAPVIVTDNLATVQNPDGTVTISGVHAKDSDPLSSTETFSVTAATEAGASGTSITPSASSGSLVGINNVLTSGVTYQPGDTPPATDKVTLTVTDVFGANDTVNFVFNQADPEPNVALQGTSGKDVIFATSSQDVLTGGAGQDQFLFAPTLGPTVQHTITDFETGIDKLDVRQFKDFSDASIPVATQQQGSDTLIILDAHDTLLLKNVFASSLHASDFLV